MDDVIATTPCKTAEELLAVLSPQHAFWQPDPSAWIFRGHARADTWKLLASAHRDGVEDVYRRWGLPTGVGSKAGELWATHRDAEWALVRLFRAALDEAGLEIPSESTDTLSAFSEIGLAGEIPVEKLPLLALAQHLGLPTSLLDWSRISTKAAYFAAADRHPGEQGDLAVWAVRAIHVDGPVFSQEMNMSLVTAPLSSNPNLHAQSGVFTRALGTKIVTVDEYVRWRHEQRVTDPPPGTPSSLLPPPVPWMHKMILPRVHARQLLKLLAHTGINGSSMFPGHAGVVKRLQEEAYWKIDAHRAG